MPEDTALDALRRHNDQLADLLSPEGRKELDRLVLLELMLHVHAQRRLDEYASRERGGDIANLDREMAEAIVQALGMPDWAKDLLKKIGSVANDYLKKTAGGVIGGGGAGAPDPE
ncbi:hypothetical protein [Jannaschia rubra]|uniref:Uncharacterized protein n=1 Tax=Jannaschia rubra TaxID=282197 RepID=A0A0M6XR21_9RHOB|nr:hypothetical protein [Jannaschia rubra]CTQ33152.1 hypothetical protein JAN5088_01932 [Jannaschia rubra]SFG79653.1 hypothetical protein SAMN04488517_11615 [Jannaschia rubra]